LYKISAKKIVIGTELFSGSREKKYSYSEIKYFFSKLISIGINHIDTAPSYGVNSSVEKVVGDCLKTKRKNFILSSKFLNKKFSNSNQRLDYLKKEFENTLKNLQTDYIDNYFFHSGENKDFFDDKVWTYLNDLKDKKYIFNLGLALKHDLVKKNSLLQLFKSKNYGISIISTTLNMFSNESVHKLIPYCKKNNLKIWGRMPLAKGLLSGKYKSINELNEKDDRYLKNKNITKAIIDYSVKYNINSFKALNWASNHSDKMIIGFKNIKQLKEILS
jgi:1-deoxyxylulose-5-phosphate synthase